MKTLLIAGANGFLGRYLTRYFVAKGWSVVGLARREEGLDEQCRYVHWDGKILGQWEHELDAADVLINLVGKSVNCRYTDENKAAILSSRVDSTKVLGRAVARSANPPQVWLNASTATLYRHSEDHPNSEGGELGEGFSVEVARAWEDAFFREQVPDSVRKVALRISMVFAKEKGTVYQYLYNLAKWGLGGKVGSGKQMVSWVHVDDFCRAVDWIAEHPEVSGPMNLAAPKAITNEEMMKRFRKLVGMPFGLPAARWMAEIGAFFLQTETELILKSRWAVPTKLEENGFVFKYPELEPWEW